VEAVASQQNYARCLLWVNRDQVIELGLRGHVRFDPDSDHGLTTMQYVAKGQFRTPEPTELLMGHVYWTNSPSITKRRSVGPVGTR
jgi:hypothetical protein